MKQLLFLTLFLPLLAVRCPDGTPTPLSTLNLTFKALYNAKPLVINQIVDYNGKKIRITKLSFFMSPVRFGTDSGNPNNVSEFAAQSAFIDFGDTDDSTKALKGVTQTFNVFNNNNLQTFSTGIGVDTLFLNNRKPQNFFSPDPLSDAGNYWDDWKSYIFTKFEGLMDKDGDGRFETGITIHTGGNKAFQPMFFVKKIDFSTDNTATLNFNLNVNELLKDIDLMTVNSTHQTGSLPTILKFTSNFQTALVLK
jgi:hypothetical protein